MPFAPPQVERMQRACTPTTWEEAARILREDPVDSAVAGGATYLMWRHAHGEPLPRTLISLHHISGYDEVTDGCVGALASLRNVERGPRSGAQRALTMAASVTAGPSVRTLATVGGNLASGFPQADLVPSLLALDAAVEFHDGTTRSAVDVMDRGLETTGLITRITHRLSGEEGWSGASVKLCRRGMDLSVGLASAVLRVIDGEIVDARLAVGSLFDRPVRMHALESALVGADPSAETIDQVVEVIGVTGRKFADDAQASAAYRARVAAPLIRRTLTLAGRLGADGTPGVGEALA
jgi:carbon-monoxide dehydrogenase medium subunit